MFLPFSKSKDEFQILIPKQIEKINKQNASTRNFKIDLFVDTAEPKEVKLTMSKLNCLAKCTCIQSLTPPTTSTTTTKCDCKLGVRSLEEYGGDYWILINGKIYCVIERKAGLDLMSSLRKTKDKIRFGGERFLSQMYKMAQLPAQRRVLLSEYKDVNNKEMQYVNIPQLFGAVTDLWMKYQMELMVSGDTYQMCYLIMKIISKLFDLCSSTNKIEMNHVLNISNHYMPFEQYEIYRKTNSGYKIEDDVTSTTADMEQIKIDERDPLNQPIDLDECEMKLVQSYKMKKAPTHEDVKIVLIHSLTVILSEPIAISIAKNFQSLSHFFTYMTSNEPQECLNFLSQLEFMNNNGGDSTASNDESICEFVDMAADHMNNNCGGDKDKKTNKRRVIGPAVVRTIYKCWFNKDITDLKPKIKKKTLEKKKERTSKSKEKKEKKEKKNKIKTTNTETELFKFITNENS
jgi:hypothetical protein